jgi:hypothetical protein
LRIAIEGPSGVVGGTVPSTLEPSKGRLHSRIELDSLSSMPFMAAMVPNAAVRFSGAMSSPVSWSRSPVSSTQTRPSELTQMSCVSGFSRALTINGPNSRFSFASSLFNCSAVSIDTCLYSSRFVIAACKVTALSGTC